MSRSLSLLVVLCSTGAAYASAPSCQTPLHDQAAALYAAMRPGALTDAQVLDHAANRVGFGISPYGPLQLANADDCTVVQVANELAGQLGTLGSVSEGWRFARVRAGVAPLTTFPRADVNAAFERLHQAGGHSNSLRVQEWHQLGLLKTLRAAVSSQSVGDDGTIGDEQVNLSALLNEFWLNHFNVSGLKAGPFMHGLNNYLDLIGAAQGGTFYGLLLKVTESPAMVFYLDNQKNIYDPAGDAAGNQNLGRELLELHTFGMGPKTRPNDPTSIYDQTDVEGMAKLLSGLSAVPVTTRVPSGDDGSVFHEALAAREPVKFLGVSYPIHTTAKARLELVLRRLANHPKTQQHLCTKLASLFYLPALVPAASNACVAAWGQDGQLKAMLRALLARSAFWSPANYRGLYRSPYESVVVTARRMGANLLDLDSSVVHEQLTAEPFTPATLTPARYDAALALYTQSKTPGFLWWLDEQVQLLSGVLPLAVAPPTGYHQDGSAYLSTGYLENLSRMPLEVAGGFDHLQGTRADPVCLCNSGALITRLIQAQGGAAALETFAGSLQLGSAFGAPGGTRPWTFGVSETQQLHAIASDDTLWPHLQSAPTEPDPAKGWSAALLANIDLLLK